MLARISALVRPLDGCVVFMLDIIPSNMRAGKRVSESFA